MQSRSASARRSRYSRGNPPAEGLLDFLEEHIHTPAALVKLADGEGRPFKVVSDECHLHHLTFDFNFGCHQSQFFRIMFPGVESGQPDAFIGQDTAL